ncbi:MAG: hypothetical protein AB1646_24000 [Thermodesulfobacteriota bacterium]
MSRITAIAASLIAVAAMIATSLAADRPLPTKEAVSGPVLHLKNAQTGSVAASPAVRPDQSLAASAAAPGNDPRRRPEPAGSAVPQAMIKLKHEAPPPSMNEARTATTPSPEVKGADLNAVGTPQLRSVAAEPKSVESRASAPVVALPSQGQVPSTAVTQDMVSARVVPLLNTPPLQEVQQPATASAGNASVVLQDQRTGVPAHQADQVPSGALLKIDRTSQSAPSPLTNQPSTQPGGRCATCPPKGGQGPAAPKPVSRAVPPQTTPSPAHRTPIQTSSPRPAPSKASEALLGKPLGTGATAAPFGPAAGNSRPSTPRQAPVRQAELKPRGSEVAPGPAKPIQSGSHFSVTPMSRPQTPKTTAAPKPSSSPGAVPRQQRTSTSVTPQGNRKPSVPPYPRTSRSTSVNRHPAKGSGQMPQIHAPVVPQNANVPGAAALPPATNAPAAHVAGSMPAETAIGQTFQPTPASPIQ